MQTSPTQAPVAAPPERHIAWVEDRQLSFYILLAIGAIVAYLTYLILHPFLAALFVAFVMAIAFFPVYQWLRKRIRPGISALMTTVLVLLLVMLPFVFISVRIATDAGNIYGSVVQPWGNPATWPKRFDPLLQDVSKTTGIPVERMKAEIAGRTRELGTWVVGLAASAGPRFAQQILTILLASVFLFPLLRYTSELRTAALSMLPLPAHRARELAIAIKEAVIADLYGMLAVGVGEGLMIAVGFWIAGLRSPLLWGVIAILLSFFPYVGVSLVWIPACILLALRGNYTQAVLLLLWCLVVVSTLEGIIRSSVVSGRARINEMLITVSIMGGVAAFGAVGLFAGPVIFALAATLVRIVREEHASAQDLGAR
jgi:predicted PurR-regulated permease PerM